MQYNWDRYHSICSAIKCPLEITADDYFVTSNGAVYDGIQAAYKVLRIMGHLRVPCLPSSSFYLPPSFYLSECFVHASVCAGVQLDVHSLENANKITDVQALTCITLH